MGDTTPGLIEQTSSPRHAHTVARKDLVSPIRASAKRDPAKIGFFDLPAELRLQIYELYCNGYVRTQQYKMCFHPGCEMHKRATVKWESYATFTRTLPLLCHQFRQEVPVTAGTFLFELSFPGHKRNRGEYTNRPLCNRPEIQDLWSQVRAFLDKVGPLAREHVRQIKVACETTGAGPYTASGDGGTFAVGLLRGLSGERISRLFERLSDVHPDLKIEVEIGCNKGYPHGSVEVKKSWILRQQTPEAVRTSGLSDWTCVEGAVLTKNIQCEDCRIHGYRGRCRCLGGVWKPYTG